jgi:hypothetical protein
VGGGRKSFVSINACWRIAVLFFTFNTIMCPDGGVGRGTNTKPAKFELISKGGLIVLFLGPNRKA